MIFDTNVLIYLSSSKLSLHEFFTTEAKICNELPVIALSDAIAEETITIRKNHRIKLADAIIYATALVNGVPLLTNNIADFKSIGKSGTNKSI